MDQGCCKISIYLMVSFMLCVCGNIHPCLVLENSAFFDADEYSYDSPSECEPEAVDDWSMNANCSFCNLQLEKLNVSQPSKATEKACLFWGVSKKSHAFLFV